MHARDELRDEPQGDRQRPHRPPEAAAAWASSVGNAAAQTVLRSTAVPRGATSPAVLARAPRALQRQADEEAVEEPAGEAPAQPPPEAAAAEAEGEELPE